MELWLALTLGAAFLQNARSMLQKRLTGELSVNGAAYVRFMYALPFAWVYAHWIGDLPSFNWGFAAYVSVGAVAQIIATATLLGSFQSGNFAVGTAFSKTEAAQAAIFGLVILGDAVTLSIALGIGVSLVGVMLLSGGVRLRDLRFTNRSLWLGLLSATAFAISVIGFRGASLSLPEGTYLERAAITVAIAVSIQTVVMGLYLRLREPGQLTQTVRAWPVAVWVGLIGMLASAGWFTAMTLESAAVVRAVGQVELIFTVAASVWFFGERLRGREIAGMVLVVMGIWLLI